MSEQDPVLRSLPRLSPGQSFCFRCHPGVSCFNQCCADLDLILHPYDVLRLRRALGLSGREFLEKHAEIEVARGTGFPLVSLKMRDDERHSCPFVTTEGCSVYADRPGACRTYPLGRGASMNEQGEKQILYVMVKEEHCRGFEEDSTWTIDAWLSDQDLAEYLEANDRHLALMNRWLKKRRELSRPQFNLVLDALYYVDEMAGKIEKGNLLAGRGVSEEQQPAILTDEPARLAFCMDWLAGILLDQS